MTNRVCVFHRGIMLLSGVYFCTQMVISFYGLRRGHMSKSTTVYLVLLVLLHVWEFALLGTLYCGVWREPPLLFLVVRLGRATLLLSAGSADTAWTFTVAIHAAVDTVLFFLVILPESRVLVATLSSVLFGAESAVMGAPMEFLVVPRTSSYRITAVLPPNTDTPALVVDRLNKSTKRRARS